VLELRPSRLDDPDAVLLTEEVQQYYLAIYGGTDQDPIDPDEFAPPRGGFLIGYEDGVPVAMGGWSLRQEAPGDAKIRRMYVREQARRHGYAAVLLDRLEVDAHAAGAARTVLETGEPQAAAVRFYRARGYTDIEAFGFYAAEDDSVHLGKRLG